MSQSHQVSRTYYFPAILLCSILLGGFAGYFLGNNAVKLKPIGDIFLNLLFTAVVPLVFFSVASAVSQIGELRRLWKIISTMLGSFLFTGIIAAAFMLVVVKTFPPAQGVSLQLVMPEKITSLSISEQIVHIFTAPEFIK